MSAVPWFAMYPTDFLAAVGHLGNSELGIYWRLLLVYYRDGGPLPCDVDRLRRLALAFTPEEHRSLDAVVSEFFVLSTEPDGRRVWRHKRADIEIARASSAKEKKSAAARATNAKRWGAAAAGSLSDSHSGREPEPEPEPEEEKAAAPPALLEVVAKRAKKTKARKPTLPLSAWLERMKASGEMPVPPGDPVFERARQAGLPEEYLSLAWQAFRRRYIEDKPNEAYADWRAVFRRAVFEDWLKLWRACRDGGYELTTVGLQLQRLMEHEDQSREKAA